MRRFSRAILAGVAVATAALSAAAQTRGSDGLPPRDTWQRVPDIIAALGPVESKRIADIAAGSGYLTKPLAARVGPTGHVYAVEVDDKALAALRALKDSSSLTNIDVVAGTTTDPKLPPDLDGAVILNSYHELADYKAMLDGIRRALKPGALFVLVDNAAGTGWFTERNDQASHHAIDPKYVVAELKAAGFEIVERQDAFIVSPYAQWLIVARRPAP